MSIVSPFDLASDALYQQWRDEKLADYPRQLDDLMIEINDPRQLNRVEYHALLACCRKTNMVIYAGKTGDNPDKNIPFLLAQQFGLKRLNNNWLADEDGISALTVAKDGTQSHYIPYTNRAIQWHTDGYYNTAREQINGMVLHCVHPASQGGDNALLDHEMVYLLLREQNPDYIQALMQPDVLTIPARNDGVTIARPVETGAVFAINADGSLHMRYTIRQRHVQWKQEPATQAALNALTALLNSNSAYIFLGKLSAGMGLLCNNVLHTRTAFIDDDNPRLLYRARYFERIAHT